jgi:hypothetical protein
MPVTSRIDVHESERVVVLQKLEAWDLPGNNLAEDAVGIGFHLSLSRQLIIVVTSPY